MITLKPADFPKRLKNIDDMPAQLYVNGGFGVGFDETPTVGIIGARDNSLYGRKVAQQIAQELANCGIIIISGMARGLDAHAHRGALSANGRTIAVLPSGINVCYPQENYEIFKQIPQNGALVTEYPPDHKPQKWHFPARNRIISALSDILIVVEAGERSGTFITVDHALNQGKEVLVVPGNITSKQSKGANMLIKQGAGIITSYLDAIIILQRQRHLEKFFKALKADNKSITMTSTQVAQNFLLANEHSLVYSCINHEPCTIDFIVYKTGLSVAQINTILLEMELMGRIKKITGNRYILN